MRPRRSESGFAIDVVHPDFACKAGRGDAWSHDEQRRAPARRCSGGLSHAGLQRFSDPIQMQSNASSGTWTININARFGDFTSLPFGGTFTIR